MRHRLSVGSSLAASIALSPAAAPAQDPAESASLLLHAPPPSPTPAPAEADGTRDSTTFVLRAQPRLTFRADTRGPDADVLVSHNPFDATMILRPNDDLRLTFTLGGEVSYYDWGGINAVFPGGSDSFSDVYSVNALAAARWTVSGRWAAVVGGVARAQGESDADFADSATGGGFLALGYNLDSDSWIDFGVGVFTRLEDDPLVVPYISLSVPVAERVRLDVRGLEAGLVAAVSDDWDVALRGRVEYRDFRLDDSRPAWRDGVVRDLRIPVGVEAAWKPIDGLTIAVEGGAVVYQEFEFLDSDGDDLGDVETEPAAYIGLRVEYRF